MMILRSAFRQLKKNVFMNTLVVIQLTAVITVICILISLIESRLEYYKPFAEEISSKGYLCNFEDYVSESELSERLPDVTFELTYAGQYYVNDQELDADDVPDSIVYSDKWIESYTPQMQSGVWLGELPDDGCIHAVVTPDNPLGLKTSDVITLSNIYGGKETVYVIGVTENKQYAVGYSAFSQTDLPDNYNFLDMYYTYNYDVEEGRWGIYLSKSEIDGSALDYGDIAAFGMGFALLDENIGESEAKEIESVLASEYGLTYVKPLEEIRKNSFGHIKEQLFVLLPIALCIFVLTLITSVSVASISTDSQLRNYAVFYICGARRSQCSLISAVSSAFICFIALLLGASAVFIASARAGTVIRFGAYQALGSLGAAAVFLLLSAVIPIAAVHGKKPKDILRGD